MSKLKSPFDLETAFNKYSEWIYHHPHSRDDEMEWLKQQGPWCPPLLDYLRRHHHQYDALLFFTYLYAPTVLGLSVAPSRSILVSTAHDEPAIRLEIFKDVFSSPAATHCLPSRAAPGRRSTCPPTACARSSAAVVSRTLRRSRQGAATRCLPARAIRLKL